MVVRAVNPLRSKALGYLREGRVCLSTVISVDDSPPVVVDARILPVAGYSTATHVHFDGDVWACSKCDVVPVPPDSCSHRLAVQMVTGWWARLGGRKHL